MSNIAKLKKKAAEYEARKHYEKALDLYEQVLTTRHTGDEERDVALYNRVGDIHYRIGNTEQALGYYEQAADFYAEGGFFNNAIALCNKILRYSPGRTVIFYKLGIISAKKGFTSDAKQNFLEYADRMQRIGKMDEAFRALKEFADLCPGQDDVRLMLAEQLARADKKQEALEQLEILYDTLESEGRKSESVATLERMKTLDPNFKPRRSITPRRRQKEGLVFLDLGEDESAETGEQRVEETEEQRVAETGEQRVAETERDTESAKADEEGKGQADGAPAAEILEVRKDASAGAGFEEQDDETEEVETVEMVDDFEATAEQAPSTDAGGAAGIEYIADVEQAAAAEPADKADAEEEEEAPAPSSELRFITPMESESELRGLDPIERAGHAGFGFVDLEVNGNGAHKENAFAEIEPVVAPDDDFIDLGEWLERNRTPSSTRMVAHDEEPENNEQKDFAEMLDKFKAGVSRNVEDADFESHYDLGIAFREMGLLDEAIGSFQKASRGPEQRVRASEAIGQCFMDKGEAGVTIKVLERLVHDPAMSDSQLVGVLYLLGRASEGLGRGAEAAGYFQRVLAVQIGFRDTASRLSALPG
ncbi:MAG: tetratricopeptide repeat protein [Gemmatimonadaceae bacterium]